MKNKKYKKVWEYTHVAYLKMWNVVVGDMEKEVVRYKTFDKISPDLKTKEWTKIRNKMINDDKKSHNGDSTWRKYKDDFDFSPTDIIWKLVNKEKIYKEIKEN